MKLGKLATNADQGLTATLPFTWSIAQRPTLNAGAGTLQPDAADGKLRRRP